MPIRRVVPAAQMSATLVHGRRPGGEPTYVQELLELLRILVVTGVSVGIVVIGLGSRLAMLLLRLTSSDSVIGVTSDDGFEIGRVTLAGTHNLMVIGAAVGFIGAVAYVAVAPWLVGPTWFRRFTVGVTAGVFVGAMLIHSDGIDFHLLGPLWLAVTLFIALPVAVGVALAVVADAVAAPGSWTARGRWRWALPLALLAVTPQALVIIVPMALIAAGLLVLRRLLLTPLRSSAVATLGVRAAFLAIPVAGSLSLGEVLTELY